MKVLVVLTFAIILGMMGGCKPSNDATEPSNPCPGTFIISGFSRDTVRIGDTVTLYGKGFGALDSESFRIGNVEAEPVSFTDSTVILTVPYAYSAPVVLYCWRGQKIFTQSIRSLEIVHRLPFTTTSISKDTGVAGDVVTIFGHGFLDRIDSLILKLDTLHILPTTVTNNSIVFTLPPNSYTGEISISTVDTSARVDYFHIIRPCSWHNLEVSIQNCTMSIIHSRHLPTDHDSVWKDTATFTMRFFSSITNKYFDVYQTGLLMNETTPVASFFLDTVSSKGHFGCHLYNSGVLQQNMMRNDTDLSVGIQFPTSSTADQPIDVVLPNSVFGATLQLNFDETELHEETISTLKIVENNTGTLHIRLYP